MATNSPQFEQFRLYVQYFTMAAAVLTVLAWVIHGLATKDFDSSNMLISGLSISTQVGGVVMGVLYLIHKSREA